MFASIRTWIARIRGSFLPQQADEDFDEELSSHLEMLTEENLRRGMSPEKAARAARIRLGGVTQLRETNRDLRGLPMVEAFLQDCRYAIRVLRKKPAFAAIAVLTLALGIGANTAVFSVASAFLRKPVSFPNTDRLAVMLELAPQQTFGWSPVSPANYLDWKQQSHSFEELAAWRWLNWNVTGDGRPANLTGVLVTTNYFKGIGTTPMLGRAFRPEEEQPGNDREAILSYGLWQSRFGSDPKI